MMSAIVPERKLEYRTIFVTCARAASQVMPYHVHSVPAELKVGVPDFGQAPAHQFALSFQPSPLLLL